MTERRNLITSKQLMVLVIGAQIGVGVISVPSELANEVGHDGWIPTLFAGLITLAASIVLALLLRRYKNKSIYDINKLLFGNIAGFILNIIFIMYLALQAIFSLRVLVGMVSTTVLQQTPVIVLTVLVCIPAAYLSWYGLKPVCRHASIVFIIIPSVCLLYILRLQHVKAAFLMPVGESFNSSGMTRGVFLSIFEYYGFELVGVAYPEITDKDKILKYIIGTIIFTMVFYLLGTITMIGFFGENMLKHLGFPLYILARTYKAPVFERLDLFFLAIWFPAVGTSLRGFFAFTYYSIIKIFNIKKFTVTLIIFVGISIILCTFIESMADLYPYEHLLNFYGIATAYIYPSICYALSFINRKGIES